MFTNITKHPQKSRSFTHASQLLNLCGENDSVFKYYNSTSHLRNHVRITHASLLVNLRNENYNTSKYNSRNRLRIRFIHASLLVSAHEDDCECNSQILSDILPGELAISWVVS